MTIYFLDIQTRIRSHISMIGKVPYWFIAIKNGAYGYTYNNDLVIQDTILDFLITELQKDAYIPSNHSACYINERTPHYDPSRD